MKDTPTPRTDEEHAQFPMGGFTLDFTRQLERELTAVTEQRDRLMQVIEAATILIAAKGRHNTMLAYNGLRDALQSLNKPTEP